MTTYLKSEDRKKVIVELGDAEFILYDYYVSKGNIPDFSYSDMKSGLALGWKKDKVQRIRLKLEKAGYLRTVRDHNTIIVYIGKLRVEESKEK